MTVTPRSNFVLILILGALTTISPLAIDMYLAAFPQIATDLNSTVGKVALSLSSYFVGLSVGQLFYGPVLDRFGRKPPLHFGLLLFILASVGCLYSHTVEALIAFRFLQALGGCAAGVAATAMVRDFFPVKEGAKVFSMLMLILSVSPLLAPTAGSFISVHFGWHAVFIFLLLVVAAILAVTFFVLPEGHQPDSSISLRIVPILRGYAEIFRDPQFFTYALSGSLSFASLFAYVAGSPIIFMEVFHVSAQTYGGIFALLSVGFIGAGQVNILLSRRFRPESIYQAALCAQVAMAFFFLVGTAAGWFGLLTTIAMLFAYLSTLGFLYPNAAALALAPFSRNAGSASALLGFLQIGAGALASMGIGLLDARQTFPIVAIFATSSSAALLVFLFGKRRMPEGLEAVPSAEEIVAPLH
ncbi:MAG: multidrug effflux MFS transporter [Bacteriovoracia bacterium]